MSCDLYLGVGAACPDFWGSDPFRTGGPISYDHDAIASASPIELRSPIADYVTLPAADLVDAVVQDDVPIQVAVVDADWNILSVNAAWAAVAALSGPYCQLSAGGNYRRHCQWSLETGVSEMAAVLDGMARVDAGKIRQFQHLYCPVDTEVDVQLSISRLEAAGTEYAVISCAVLSELCELRRRHIELGSSVLTAQDDERQRIARDFHDSAAQHLIGMSLGIAHLRQVTSDPAIGTIAGELSVMLNRFHRELRGMTFIMHPPALQNGGLRAAVKSLCAGFAQRTGIALILHVESSCPTQQAAPEATIYRLVQEALSNVHKHAAARQVHVRLNIRADRISVAVRDDGVGLGACPVAGGDVIAFGVGITGMIARVHGVGGRLQMRSRGRDRGTIVAASVPRGSNGYPHAVDPAPGRVSCLIARYEGEEQAAAE